jgi:glycosyltransferase involved in cell wall biosynthesis
LLENKVLISVCIFVYNGEKFISESIESILSQDFDDFELVIVDDGSTDRTAEIIEGYSNPKLRYFYKENSGRPKSRNRCIKEARGEYILWFSSDDVLAAGTLKKYAALINEFPETDIFQSNMLMTDENLTPTREMKYENWVGRQAMLQALLPLGNRLHDPAAVCRKKLYDKFGGYDPDFVRSQDYEWFMRVSGHTEIRHSDFTSFYYRRTRVSLGEKPIGNLYAAAAVNKFLRTHSIEELASNAGFNVPAEIAPMFYRIKLVENFFNCADYESALTYINEILNSNAPLQIKEGAGQLLMIYHLRKAEQLINEAEYQEALPHIKKVLSQKAEESISNRARQLLGIISSKLT